MGIITGPYASTTTTDCGIRIWNAPVRLPSSTKSWRLARKFPSLDDPQDGSAKSFLHWDRRLRLFLSTPRPFGFCPFHLHFQLGSRQQLVHDLIPRNHAFQSSV